MYWRHNDLRANYVRENTEFHYMQNECIAQLLCGVKISYINMFAAMSKMHVVERRAVIL